MKKTWIWLVVIAVAIIAYMNWDKIKAMMPNKKGNSKTDVASDLLADSSQSIDSSVTDERIKLS